MATADRRHHRRVLLHRVARAVVPADGRVTAGVVLLRSPASNNFTPVALWPLAPRDMSHLGAAAEIALRENRGVVQRAGGGEAAAETRETPWHIAYPLGSEQQVLGTVTLEVPPCPEARVHEYVRQLHWGLGLLRERLVKRAASAESEQLQRLGSVMEVIATSVSQAPLQESLFSITNLIARELGVVARGAGPRGPRFGARGRDVRRRLVREEHRSGEALRRGDGGIPRSARHGALRCGGQGRHAEVSVNAEHAALARVTAADSVIEPAAFGRRELHRRAHRAAGGAAPPHGRGSVLAGSIWSGLLPSVIEHKRRGERGLLRACWPTTCARC